MTKIIVKLRGGLGNQMFQYALGRHLAERRHAELLLDPYSLSNPEDNLTPRLYELDLFPNLRATVITRTQLKALRRSVPYTVWYTEGRFGFYREVFERTSVPAIGIDGYWQSEKYFEQISPTIRHDLGFDESSSMSALCEAMSSPKSVCIHVRRGDYLSPIGAHLGFVGLEYYARACAIIEEQITAPSHFVFSDDIPWCRDNMSFLGACTFVEPPMGERPAISLRMMSCCQHFIIANSSFSWWAAWLSSNRQKVIVAPRRWFAREGDTSAKAHTNKFSSIDIVPDTWVRI